MDDCNDGGIGNGLRNRRLSSFVERNVSLFGLNGSIVEYMLMPLSTYVDGHRYGGFFGAATDIDAWSGVDFEWRSAKFAGTKEFH